jgi:hypothetical protein
MLGGAVRRVRVDLSGCSMGVGVEDGCLVMGSIGIEGCDGQAWSMRLVGYVWSWFHFHMLIFRTFLHISLSPARHQKWPVTFMFITLIKTTK